MFLEIQGWTIRPSPGLVNFVPAVAYHFCLNLPAAFLQPGNGLLEGLCRDWKSTLGHDRHYIANLTRYVEHHIRRHELIGSGEDR